MDLTFKTPMGKFNFRVGAILIKDDAILLVKGTHYYYTIGGRIKYNETSKEAIIREVKEEIGIELEVDRPVFYNESFFDEVSLNEHFHEVCLYYLMKVENSEKFNRYNENKKEELVWIPINELNKYRVYPEFYKTRLRDLPTFLEII